MADALRAIGQHVETHHEHFSQDAQDVDWLIPVGKKGWVVLTKDRHLRSNQVEVESIIRANIACFSLVSADLTGEQMAQAFVAALGSMLGMLRRIQRPFVASVSRLGRVDLLFRYSDLARRLER